MQMADYLRMPWTILRSDHEDDGHYVALRIAELPGFVVAAESEKEIEGLFWPALEAFIESYLEDGDAPPLPARARGRSLRIQRPVADGVFPYAVSSTHSVGVAPETTELALA